MQVHRLPDGSLTASFVYNAEGLRVQKTVNGVVTKYILHGKNITHLIRGNDELHFFYDASGSPAMVEWNNGTATEKYAYVKNLQDDTITFGHGGRHLEGTKLNISEVNKTIAEDILTKNIKLGQFYKGQITIQGNIIEYTSFGVGEKTINIGTYYLK